MGLNLNRKTYNNNTLDLFKSSQTCINKSKCVRIEIFNA